MATNSVTMRLQDTALQAERELRLALENQLRAYHALLEDLTHRLGFSERMDALRHEDPTIPKGWGPMQWRAFLEDALENLQKPQSKGWRSDDHRAEIARLQQEIAAMQAELKSARQESDAWRTEAEKLQEQIRRMKSGQKPSEPKPATKASQQSQSAPRLVPQAKKPAVELEAEAVASPVYRAWVTTLTEMKMPARTVLPIGMRDLLPSIATRRKRMSQILFAVAVLGLSIRPEIDLLLAAANGLKPRSGSVRRVFDEMLEKGLLEADTLRLKSPATRLALVRLGEKGRALASVLFDMEPVESEWERLNRLHEGERFPSHTVAVLLFALHARLRGWRAEVMPSLDDNATPPDVAIERDGQRLFVEVELGKKDRGAKWQNNAAANDGTVALCAGTVKRRELLVGDCKRQGLHGVATDLESMIGIPWVKITPSTPLWIERW